MIRATNARAYEGKAIVKRWQRFTERLGILVRWPTKKAMRLAQREGVVISWVREGLTAAEIGDRLVGQGWHPIYEAGPHPPYDLPDVNESAKRTGYALTRKLIRHRRVREDEVKRRRRGRPRKKPMT